MDTYRSRDEWGARPAKSSIPDFVPDEVKGIVIHHTAGPKPKDHADCDNEMRRLQDYFLDRKDENYADIAYNFVVCAHGVTFEGRGYINRSGANGSSEANRAWVAVCLMGTNPEPNSATADAVRARRFGVMKRYGLDARKVRAHSDLKATDCPGSNWREWIEHKAYKL
jgi:hypothetical protein